MRLQRHQIGIDDFKLLTLIGKGSFRENVLVKLNYDDIDLF
ncbi:hypothetical protein HanRHA438_Chr00c69g0862241 [Helianthus annuus]|nr:hypothetical protein HanRHA438_Chr00c69g0862241 [Helianthus annuus]